jgi:hypothetical protein
LTNWKEERYFVFSRQQTYRTFGWNGQGAGFGRWAAANSRSMDVFVVPVVRADWVSTAVCEDK